MQPKRVPIEDLLLVAETYGYEAPALKVWTSCRCSKSHKNSGSWIKCRLNYYHDNGENKHKPAFDTSAVGSGKLPWVVLTKTYSGDYYTEWNGRTNNQGYYEYGVQAFSTHKDALNRYHQMATKNCTNHPDWCWKTPCRFIEPYIIEISNFSN